MKITENINLGGLIFTIDDDALLKLQNYLNSIERYFGAKDEREEILADIEARIAEHFQTQLSKNKEVITMSDVDNSIEILGMPEDFVETGSHPGSSQRKVYPTAYKKLFRNPNNSILGGVCNGFGQYFNIDPVIVRVIFVLLGIFGGGIILYLVLWVVLPAEFYQTDKFSVNQYSSVNKQ